MGGDNVGKGSFGCVACTSMMALIFYAVGLAMPIWAGYYVNDRKCEREGDKGCGYDDNYNVVKKGQDVPAIKCQFEIHGIYIHVLDGPTKPGLDAQKKQNKNRNITASDATKTCEERNKNIAKYAKKKLSKEQIDDVAKCDYDEDSMTCACPYPSKDVWWAVMETVFDQTETEKKFCETKAKEEKKYDDIQKSGNRLEMAKASWANVKIAAITLVIACVCHFIAMIMGYIGLVTGHFATGIVAACLNIVAVCCAITGLVTGTAGVYLIMTGEYCGSWKWYKADNYREIPQPDDQVHPMGMGAIMVIVGIVFSVISACASCGSVAAAKRGAAEKNADANYNKF